MFKKSPFILTAVLCLCGFLYTSAAAQNEAFSFEDIDALLENNTLNDAANRYASTLVQFFPEKATRLGFSSTFARLDNRYTDQSADASAALQSTLEALKNIDVKRLSPAKQADYNLLKNAVEADLLRLERNPVANDPLYYAQAIDSVYDIMLKTSLPKAYRQKAVLARLKALPVIAAQAKSNLNLAPTYLSQQAMEKAYYAYLAFDEIVEFVLQDVPDTDTQEQITNQLTAPKKAIKDMFELFKDLSQEKNSQDFRLTSPLYARILKTYYQTEEKPSVLKKELERNFEEAQKELADALAPFVVEAQLDEEVTIVDDLNALPTTEEAAPEPKAKKKEKKKKAAFVPPSAAEFYAVASRLEEPMQAENWEAFAAEQAQESAKFLSAVLPLTKGNFSVLPLPRYYSYTQPHLFLPSFGTMEGAAINFYLREPSGNELTKQEMLKHDFNAPSFKMMMTREIMPGRYLQTAATDALSPLRRQYPAVSLQNGWADYAQLLAKESNWIVTDPELLFAAWENYKRAAAALVDAKLHTREFSYTDAVNFLMQTNGWNEQDTQAVLRVSAARPGEAVSRVTGMKTILEARKQYQKKQGKHYSPVTFHSLLLRTGNILPKDLSDEIERLQKEKK